MATPMHTMVAAVLALGAACCAPAWSAAAITQNTTDTNSISLSNLEGDETNEPPLVTEAAAKGADAGEPVARETGKVPRSGSANTAATSEVASSKQQRAQDQMFKQATLNGTPVGNAINARKYLKVDRATYLNGLNN